MPKVKKVFSVCNRCGAVGTVKQPHCVFCGALLDKTMQVNAKKNRGKLEKSRGNGSFNDGVRRKKLTALSLFALLFGVLAALKMAIPITVLIPDTGFCYGAIAVIFSILSFRRRKGGTVPSVIGIVLGGYTLFVNILYFFWQFFYLFID